VLEVVLEEGLNHPVRLGLLGLSPIREVHGVEEESPQLHHRVPCRIRHPDGVGLGTVRDHVVDHGLDPRAVVVSEHLTGRVWKRRLCENATSDGVVDIVVHVRDPVRDAHDLPLECRGRMGSCVAEDAVSHLPREVQSLTLVLEVLHDAQGLQIVSETVGCVR